MTWITCRFCGEKRNTSNAYTSPANQRKDREEWERVHDTGLCLRLQFRVTRIVHRDCEDCNTAVEQAITTAQVTGSVGGSYLVSRREARPGDPNAMYISHGGTVARADHLPPVSLRTDHTCQVRRTSSTLSPLCGRPAYTTWWIDGGIWTCDEHDQYHGYRGYLNQGMLPANRRAARVGRWAAGQ